MAVGLFAVLAYGSIVGLVQGGREGLRPALATGFVAGLAVGLIVGLLGVIFPERFARAGGLFAPGDLVGVVAASNLAIALVRSRAGPSWSPRWADSFSMGATNGALVEGMSMLHQVVRGADLTVGFFLKNVAELLGAAAIGALMAPPISYLAFWLRPRFRVFVALAPYLREIWVPLSAFAFTYLSLIFLFAILIGAVWRADPAGAYSGLSAAPRFGAFFYLSVETITGLGYARTLPNSASAKTLASVEAITGMLWNTVFVATFIAYLQPRFRRVRREQDAPPSS